MREALLQDFISFKMSVTYCDIYTLKIMNTTLDLLFLKYVFKQKLFKMHQDFFRALTYDHHFRQKSAIYCYRLNSIGCFITTILE